MSQPKNIEEFYAQLDAEEAAEVVADQPTVVQEAETPHEPMAVAPLPRGERPVPQHVEEAPPPPEPAAEQPSIKIDFSRFQQNQPAVRESEEVNVAPQAQPWVTWLWVNGRPTINGWLLLLVTAFIVVLFFIVAFFLWPTLKESAAEGQLPPPTPIMQTTTVAEGGQTQIMAATDEATDETEDEGGNASDECASPVPAIYLSPDLGTGTGVNYPIPQDVLPESGCYNLELLKEGGTTNIGVWGGDNWCQDITKGGKIPKTFWKHDFTCELHISGSFVFPPEARISITNADGKECIATNNEIGPRANGRWADYPLLITPAVAACLGAPNAETITDVHLKLAD